MNNVPSEPIQLLPSGLKEKLTESPAVSDALGESGVHLENVAFHNFAAYEYVFDPWIGIDLPSPDLTEEEKALIEEYLGILNEIHGESEVNAAGIPQFIMKVRDLVVYKSMVGWGAEGFTYFSIPFLIQFLQNLPAIYEVYVRLSPPLKSVFFEEIIKPAIDSFFWDCHWVELFDGSDALACAPGGEIDWPAILDRGRSLLLSGKVTGRSKFIPYEPGSINIGLRLVYRQEWRSLGNQDGEVVRTIPLGPRQVEKISIKVVKRNKGTRQLEKVVATERQFEGSETNKDSAEIVEEASKTKQWEVSGEAEFDIGIFKAGGGGGSTNESASMSKENKTKLSEVMQKTATKMRRETKVVVSTESEFTFEETHASEISNPNDEVAVTYVYHRLQKQYEIHTHLSEVASVIFVAEHVPKDHEITTDWVRQYAWIIAKVLLDECFEAALNFIAENPDSALKEDWQDLVWNNLMTSAKSSLSEIQNLQGDVANTFGASAESYRAYNASKREKERELASLTKQIDNFLDHIKQNILHYCRAIWSHEDPEIRLNRYSQIYIPSEFLAVEEETDTLGDGSVRVGVSWVPDMESRFVALSEVINPAGPIGFAGNYAIYHLKNFDTPMFREPLTYLKLKYAAPTKLHVYPNEANSHSTEEGGNVTYHANVIGEITHDWRITYQPYVLKFELDQQGLRYRLIKEPVNGAPEDICSELYVDSNGKEICAPDEGFKLIVSGAPKAGDTFSLLAAIPNLRDPELTYLQQNYPLPPAGVSQEGLLFDDELILEMLQLMPNLVSVLESLSDSSVQEPIGYKWNSMNENQKKHLRSIYHDFILRREHTRRFLVDTNSLVVNLHVGSGSTLEPFKLGHRFYDLGIQEQKLKRYIGLNDSGDYRDPDVDKKIIIECDDIETVKTIVGSNTDDDS